MATVEKAEASEIDQEVDWVQRRDFSCVAAGTILGLGIRGLELDRLAALLPTGSTRRIGTSDVAAIEHTTDMFRALREQIRTGDPTWVTRKVPLATAMRIASDG